MLCELPKEKSQSTSETGRLLKPFHPRDLLQPQASLMSILGDVPHQKLPWLLPSKYELEVWVRRDDLIHPRLSGNKVYKLYGHIQHWQKTSPSSVLCSFGGAYSNHLHALAALGAETGKQTLGVIRGHKPKKLSPTLLDLQSMGMKLVFVDRTQYKRKHTLEFQYWLKQEHEIASAYWIPEGGGGELGMQGCIELGSAIGNDGFDTVALACGTGTTFIGMLQGLNRDQRAGARQYTPKLLGISALRNSFEVARSLVNSRRAFRQSWSISNQFHCGGFAKSNKALEQFMREFYTETALPVEKVYTGKLFYALSRMIESRQFEAGSRILAIHSGGLQGVRQHDS